MKAELLCDTSQIVRWFALADRLKERTPKSFEIYLKNSGFTNDIYMSDENLKAMLNAARRLNMLQVYPSEVVSFLQEQISLASGKKVKVGKYYEKKIDFRIIDIRRDRCNNYLPFSVEIPSSVYKTPGDIQKYARGSYLL